MARIHPFQAYRFNSDQVPDIGEVLAPPYDRINAEMLGELRQRSVYNMTHLMPSRPEVKEETIDLLSRKAETTLRDWLARKVLVADEKPGLYYYRQGFIDAEGRHRVRKGFFALLGHEPEESGIVLHQERTWGKPRVSRLRIMERTHMQMAPILLLFSDPEREVMSLLAGAAADRLASITVDDGAGNSHSITSLSDPALIERVTELLAPQTVILADGHHRYRTSQAYAAAYPERPEVGRVLACLVPIQDDGLSFRPIHRAVHDLPDFKPNELLFELAQTFYIRELSAMESGDPLEAALSKQSDEAMRDETMIVMGIAGLPEILLLTVKNDAARLVLPEGMAEPIRDLDVALLHRLILEGPLKLHPKRRERGNLVFFDDSRRGREMLESREFQVVFLLAPPRVEQLAAVLSARLKLPHKTVRFCPDIPAGLLLYSLQELRQ